MKIKSVVKWVSNNWWKWFTAFNITLAIVVIGAPISLFLFAISPWLLAMVVIWILIIIAHLLGILG